MLPQQYCLRWRYHHSNLQTMFSQLLEREAFCDVTLACEGRTIKAHKIVLSACSTYFETILSQYEEKDPILIMKDVKYVDIKCLVEFMYKGEINVDHCHLATLLKTAEELRIKGLAEVSWKEDENNKESNKATNNGVQNALPQVSTVMDTPKLDSNLKRKRGRPPIDDYEAPYPAPKIVSVTSITDENYSNDAMSSSDQDHSTWEDEQGPNELEDVPDADEPLVKIKTEITHDDNDDDENLLLIDESAIDPIAINDSKGDLQRHMNASTTKAGPSSISTNNTTSTSSITPALEREWSDVIKMNDYLNTGRRQQFWEEPFTKRVMDAIKNKNLEMKIAAELLGVSYGTLYGRYRDAYGCLKHPYRVRDFWTEQGPTDILIKLKKKEITLFRAAEQLNVTPQTLSNYLISMSVIDKELNLSAHQHINDQYDEGDTDDDIDSMHSDGPSNNSLYKVRSNHSGSSVLPNCPDITIIKKDKLDSVTSKINNNSDHSERQSGIADQK